MNSTIITINKELWFRYDRGRVRWRNFLSRAECIVGGRRRSRSIARMAIRISTAAASPSICLIRGRGQKPSDREYISSAPPLSTSILVLRASFSPLSPLSPDFTLKQSNINQCDMFDRQNHASHAACLRILQFNNSP